MTLGILKTNVAALLSVRNDVAMKTDNAIIIPLVNMAMLNIANRYKVLKLMTKSENFKVLRALSGENKGWYIRMPKEPKTDDDKLDMDSELCMALVNYVAADLAANIVNRNIFKKSARKIVKDYSFKIHDTATRS